MPFVNVMPVTANVSPTVALLVTSKLFNVVAPAVRTSRVVASVTFNVPVIFVGAVTFSAAPFITTLPVLPILVL
ncbi:hypothetical protein SDC9_168637 [bioreactor metagenome]|uniref:Uncharacterized protein n=1 Tax=bioreactor metagenome TaxID=1076179 RepID=A0A645G325_9ZZZZ